MRERSFVSFHRNASSQNAAKLIDSSKFECDTVLSMQAVVILVIPIRNKI